MEEFLNLIKGEKPVFVEFFATWCPHCLRMSPIIEGMRKKMKEDMIILQLDIDKKENHSLVEYYKVQAVPSMMIFKGGEQLWRQNGEIQEQKLLRTLNRIS